MRAGESAAFSLSYTENAPAVLPPLDQVPHRIETCVGWWTRWVSQMRYDGEFKEEVIRSALALKLMTFAPSGAIIAAPTTSLPEKIGGGLNWDYRYCWLRDASMTIRAMIELGYWQEASAFLDWMLHATRLTQPELHILYTVFGNRAPREWKSGLRGYRGSSPVRIGNAARDQLQLDVYGEVIDAAAQYAFHGGNLDLAMQKALAGFGDYVLGHWQLPDEGIWEPRTGRTHHTHSRLLCWTSLDRLLTLLVGPVRELDELGLQALILVSRVEALDRTVVAAAVVLPGAERDGARRVLRLGQRRRHLGALRAALLTDRRARIVVAAAGHEAQANRRE